MMVVRTMPCRLVANVGHEPGNIALSTSHELSRISSIRVPFSICQIAARSVDGRDKPPREALESSDRLRCS
jgi:hypothetical protein